MADRGLKAMTRTRTPKFGCFIVEFATPGIGHIMKSAGCDFVLFDMEHSGFSFETVKSTLRYFEAADLAAIVRVPSQQSHHIARGMDMGVEGLMAPMVSNAEQVRAIAKAMKYHPQGARGVALQIAHDRYRPGSVADKFAAANVRAAFVCLIETAEGVNNIDEIAAMPEVDIIWIGHFDLSVSLGVPGEFASAPFREAIDRIMAAAERNGKSVGRMAGSIEQGVELNRAGCDFVIYSGDIWILHDGLAAAISGLRERCGTGPAEDGGTGERSR